MSAVSTLSNHYSIQFAANWLAKAQQSESRLKEFVTMQPYEGERKAFSLYDAFPDPNKITTKAADTTHHDPTLERRWIHCDAFDQAVLQDEWEDDLLGAVSDPTSQFFSAMQRSANRKCDDLIIDALTGSAYTGKNGTTAVAHDTTNQQIAVNAVAPGESAANSNLTVEKIIQGKSIFGVNEVAGQDADGEQICMAISQSQVDSLLRDDKFINKDYFGGAFDRGEVEPFLNVRFKRLERLDVASNVRTAIMWVKSGVYFTMGDYRADLDIIPTKSHSKQARVRFRAGGVRTEEKKVVTVLCDETA